MPATPNTFAKICAAAKIPVPAAAERPQFLADAGVATAAGTHTRELAEPCAALAWARASLVRQDDPTTWLTSLPAAVHPTLMALYPLPPHRGPSAAPPDVVRLASVIDLYAPASAPSPPIPPAAPAGGSGTINTGRPPAGGSGGGALPPAAPPTAAPPAPTPASSGVPPAPALPKPLLHDDLAALLPPSVYHALDATSGMPPEKRAKFQESCRKSSLSTVLDWTTSPPFGHQANLFLAKGTHFDPVKRGLAFALAGRSACADASASSLTDTMTCDAHLRLLREQWTTMLPALAADAELSSTHVNNLWAGATFVMTLRAARSAAWGVPEVEAGCRAQLAGLPAYRTAIATVLSRVSSAYTGAEAARSINRAYLQFFLPFWWEHILERGVLDADKLDKTVDSLLLPRVLHPPPAQPPAALPPVATPPPPPFPPVPWPHSASPAFPPFPHSFFAGGPHPGVPPPAPLPTPGPTPPAATPPASGNRIGFIGKPLSALICGKNFGVTVPGTPRLCTCPISRAFTGHSHFPLECPFRYHAHRGSCPGWTATGQRIPAAWAGDDITPACQAEWRTFAASLPISKIAGTTEIQF